MNEKVPGPTRVTKCKIRRLFYFTWVGSAWVELKSNKPVDQPGIQPEHSIIPVDENLMCFIVLKSPERNCCSFFSKPSRKNTV